MPIGTVITVNFSNSASRDSSALSLAYFTKAAGAGVATEGTYSSLAADATATVGSMNGPTCLTTIEQLRVRAVASEGNTATAMTKTAAFDGTFTTANSTGGTAATRMGIRGEYDISTGNATLASNPTANAGTVDHASVYVAFREQGGTGAATGSGTASGSGVAVAAGDGAASGSGTASAIAYSPVIWILATGVWNDAGVWDDGDVWNDGAAAGSATGSAAGTSTASAVGVALKAAVGARHRHRHGYRDQPNNLQRGGCRLRRWHGGGHRYRAEARDRQRLEHRRGIGRQPINGDRDWRRGGHWRGNRGRQGHLQRRRQRERHQRGVG